MEFVLRDDIAPGRVQLQGSLDIYAAADLHARLLQWLAAHPRLELDLSEVDDMDTSAVQLLMAAKRHARSQGRSLHLVAHSAPVLRTLELCQLLGYFGDPVVETPARSGGAQA